MTDFYIQYPDGNTKLVKSVTEEHKVISYISDEEWQKQVEKNTKRFKQTAERILS
jgi:hypothetical protein